MGLDIKPGIAFHKSLTDPKAVQYWERLCGRVLDGDKFRAEFQQELADGNVRYFDISFCPIVENGNMQGFVKLGRDISERKRSEAELRKLREEWELIFQSTGNLSFILDRNHSVIHTNNAAEKATARSKEEPKTWSDFQNSWSGL
ncbi:MAG: PAS domain-containing protein [Desulfobacteraceae bacterium]